MITRAAITRTCILTTTNASAHEPMSITPMGFIMRLTPMLPSTPLSLSNQTTTRLIGIPKIFFNALSHRLLPPNNTSTPFRPLLSAWHRSSLIDQRFWSASVDRRAPHSAYR